MQFLWATKNFKMTDKPNLEYLDEVKAEKLTSLAEDSKNERGEMLTDSERGENCGINRPIKAAKSKREIMEELTRQRFPWEE